jgi:hypothetical protein
VVDSFQLSRRQTLLSHSMTKLLNRQKMKLGQLKKSAKKKQKTKTKKKPEISTGGNCMNIGAARGMYHTSKQRKKTDQPTKFSFFSFLFHSICIIINVSSSSLDEVLTSTSVLLSTKGVKEAQAVHAFCCEMFAAQNHFAEKGSTDSSDKEANGLVRWPEKTSTNEREYDKERVLTALSRRKIHLASAKQYRKLSVYKKD